MHKRSILCCRCEISFAKVGELVVIPEWFEDPRQHKFVLLGLLCIAPELKTARDSILEEEPSQSALWTVQSING